MDLLLKMLSANEVVAQVVSFLILLTLLRVFAWKKILGLLDKRKEKISAEFKQIEDTKAEVLKLRQDYESKLRDIEGVAEKKIQEAVAAGRNITDEVRKKANEEAQDIIIAARENIKHELSKAKEELKINIIELTMKATEDVIQEKLTEETDRKLVEDFLKRVDEID